MWSSSSIGNKILKITGYASYWKSIFPSYQNLLFINNLLKKKSNWCKSAVKCMTYSWNQASVSLLHLKLTLSFPQLCLLQILSLSSFTPLQHEVALVFMWYLHVLFAGDLAPLQLKGKVCTALCCFMSLDLFEGTCPQGQAYN